MNLRDSTTTIAPAELLISPDYHMLEPPHTFVNLSLEVASNVNMISRYVSQILVVYTVATSDNNVPGERLNGG